MDHQRKYKTVYNKLYSTYSKYMNNPSYVYFSCNNEWIVIMEKFDYTKISTYEDLLIKDDIIKDYYKNISKDDMHAEYYANTLKVVLIFNKFDHNKTLEKITPITINNRKKEINNVIDQGVYEIGKFITSSFGDECKIQFFKSIMRAYYFDIHRVDNYTGECLFYNDSGLYQSTSNFVNGIIIDSYRYSDGRLIMKCNYIDGNVYSAYIEDYNNVYYDDMHDIEEKSLSKYKIINNKIEGEKIVYYSNGNISSISNYVNDKLHGVFTKYKLNEKLHSISTYVNGKLHGEYTRYYENGPIEMKCNYVNDKLHGEYIQYNPEETILSKLNYVDDKLHGVCIQYSSNGIISSISNYVNGYLHGDYILYDTIKNSNEPIEKITYINGVKNGKYINFYDIKSLNPVTNIQSTFNINNGYLDGEYILYNINGQMIAKYNYSDNKLCGECVMYNSCDQIILKYNCNDDKIVGDIQKS